MSIEEHIAEALQQTRDAENARLSHILSGKILVGPFEDGFAIFMHGYRIGKWLTREEACDQGTQLGVALRRILADCIGGKRP